MHFDPVFFNGTAAIEQAKGKNGICQRPISLLAIETRLPGCLGILADTDQCCLDLWVSVHYAPKILRRDVVLPKIRICDRDDKVVVWDVVFF
jgi:hypothetical protein